MMDVVKFPMEAHPHYCVMHGMSFLCHGNLSHRLSYHESWIDLVDEKIVMCDLRSDAAQHKARWINQLRNIGMKIRNNQYRVVRVQFYWVKHKRGAK